MKKEEVFKLLVEKNAKLPGVSVRREDFLRKTFQKQYKYSNLDKIVELGPIVAGVAAEDVGKYADKVIMKDALAVNHAGGRLGAVLIIMQKLMYLYGWEEDVFGIEGCMDETTEKALILYMGFMVGVKEANNILIEISAKYSSKRNARYIGKLIFEQERMSDSINEIAAKVGCLFLQEMKRVVIISKTLKIDGGISTRVLGIKLKKHFEGK